MNYNNEKEFVREGCLLNGDSRIQQNNSNELQNGQNSMDIDDNTSIEDTQVFTMDKSEDEDDTYSFHLEKLKFIWDELIKEKETLKSELGQKTKELREQISKNEGLLNELEVVKATDKLTELNTMIEKLTVQLDNQKKEKENVYHEMEAVREAMNDLTLVLHKRTTEKDEGINQIKGIKAEIDYLSGNILDSTIQYITIAEGACNDINNDFVIQSKYLKSIVVKKNAMKNLNSLKICDCPVLETFFVENGNTEWDMINQSYYAPFENMKSVELTSK